MPKSKKKPMPRRSPTFQQELTVLRRGAIGEQSEGADSHTIAGLYRQNYQKELDSRAQELLRHLALDLQQPGMVEVLVEIFNYMKSKDWKDQKWLGLDFKQLIAAWVDLHEDEFTKSLAAYLDAIDGKYTEIADVWTTDVLSKMSKLNRGNTLILGSKSLVRAMIGQGFGQARKALEIQVASIAEILQLHTVTDEDLEILASWHERLPKEVVGYDDVIRAVVALDRHNQGDWQAICVQYARTQDSSDENKLPEDNQQAWKVLESSVKFGIEVRQLRESQGTNDGMEPETPSFATLYLAELKQELDARPVAFFNELVVDMHQPGMVEVLLEIFNYMKSEDWSTKSWDQDLSAKVLVKLAEVVSKKPEQMREHVGRLLHQEFWSTAIGSYLCQGYESNTCSTVLVDALEWTSITNLIEVNTINKAHEVNGEIQSQATLEDLRVLASWYYKQPKNGLQLMETITAVFDATTRGNEFWWRGFKHEYGRLQLDFSRAPQALEALETLSDRREQLSPENRKELDDLLAEEASKIVQIESLCLEGTKPWMPDKSMIMMARSSTSWQDFQQEVQRMPVPGSACGSYAAATTGERSALGGGGGSDALPHSLVYAFSSTKQQATWWANLTMMQGFFWKDKPLLAEMWWAALGVSAMACFAVVPWVQVIGVVGVLACVAIYPALENRVKIYKKQAGSCEGTLRACDAANYVPAARIAMSGCSAVASLQQTWQYQQAMAFALAKPEQVDEMGALMCGEVARMFNDLASYFNGAMDRSRDQIVMNEVQLRIAGKLGCWLPLVIRATGATAWQKYVDNDNVWIRFSGNLVVLGIDIQNIGCDVDRSEVSPEEHEISSSCHILRS